MKDTFSRVEDYTCEVEQIYYKKGEEGQRYRFKYFFRKGKKIRIDFSSPYSNLTILYRNREDYATVIPFRSFPSLRFRFSLDSSTLKTPTGQRIDQTDLEYFTQFLFQNLAGVKQKEEDFREEKGEIIFWFWARDYLKGKDPEKYRIFISRENWFPVRIERYNLEGQLIEVSLISNYILNARLKDALFSP